MEKKPRVYVVLQIRMACLDTKFKSKRIVYWLNIVLNPRTTECVVRVHCMPGAEQKGLISGNARKL